MHALALCCSLALLGGGSEGLLLQDGKEIPGNVVSLTDGAVVLAGHEEPFPLYELNAITLSAPSGDDPPALGAEDNDRDLDRAFFDSGPLVRFREGPSLQGRVLRADEERAEVEVVPPRRGAVSSAPTDERQPLLLDVPLEVLLGFRLREALREDSLFEDDLERPPALPRGLSPGGVLPGGPESAADPQTSDGGSAGAHLAPGDLVYVRRPGGLLRVEGAFQSLDEEYLTISIGGKARRLRRQLVLGVILAPVATPRVEDEIPAVIDLRGVGEVPAFVRAIDGSAPRREIAFRFRGSETDEIQTVAEGWVERVKLSSDRVLFLSAVDPVYVEEVPLVGTRTTFPFRRDRAVSGGPLRLGGRTYRRGLGVHSRSILVFDIGARFTSLASAIGLDETAGEGSGVTFRVLADGKEIYTRDASAGDRPENLSLPMDGVRRVRLEVDYGPDGVDFGDYANWADLRVTR